MKIIAVRIFSSIYRYMRMNTRTIFIPFTRWPPYWHNVRTVTVQATGSIYRFRNSLCKLVWYRETEGALATENVTVASYQIPGASTGTYNLFNALLIFGDTLQKFQNTPLVSHLETGVIYQILVNLCNGTKRCVRFTYINQ